MFARSGGNTLLFKLLAVTLALGVAGCGGGGGGSSGTTLSPSLPSVPVVVSWNPSTGAPVVTNAMDTDLLTPGVQTTLLVSGLPFNQLVRLFLGGTPKGAFASDNGIEAMRSGRPSSRKASGSTPAPTRATS